MNLLRTISATLLVLLAALFQCATTAYAVNIPRQLGGGEDKMSHLEIANALWQAGKIDKAEELFKTSIAATNDASQALALSNRLADLYVATGRCHDAIKIYDELLSKNEIRSDTSKLMDIYDCMGRAYLGMRMYNKAYRCFRNALDVMRASQDTLFAMIVYNDMANTLLTAGNLLMARDMADSAINLAHNQDWQIEAECQKTSARIYAKMHDYETAYNRMELSMQHAEKMWEYEIDAINSSSENIGQQRKGNQAGLNNYNNMELRSQVSEALTSKKMAQSALLGSCLIAIAVAIAFAIAINKQHTTEEENKKLSMRNKENEKIISIIAHDATNQFNTLIGFTSVQMEEMKGKDKDAYDAMQQINIAALSLHDMLSNMATWVMTKGNLKPVFRDVPVATVVEKVLKTCNLMIQSKNINVSYNIDPSICAYVDASHLEIVIRNIINNAVKFTPRDGAVSISAITHSGHTSIIIEDTGVGMSEEIVQQFNANEHINTYEGTEHEKGMGLGLSICREMVILNNGEMVISSIADRGTSVTIVFKKGTYNEKG